MNAIVLLFLFVTLATPAWAGTTRCTTVEQKTMQQRYTVCDDGTRAVCSNRKHR